MLGFDALGVLALGQIPSGISGAAVYEDSWHLPFSTDRDRRRPPFSASIQQFASFVEFAPFNELVSADRWFVVLSEPTRLKRTLATSSQQFAAFVEASPFAETISADRWAQPLSEPSRSRKPMHIGAQQFASFVQFAPFSERVSADKWFVPFSEPTRFKQIRISLHTGAQQFASFVNYAPFDVLWFQSLSEPVRSRKPMHTGSQQFASYVQFAPFAETVTADRWFVPFSEPIRLRQKLIAANHWASVSIEFPITAIVVSEAVILNGTASLTGIPTSNYKMILTETKRRLIYAAEISPWTVSDRNA
jgi:hypothetical protein